jgi:hypothetical protein
LPGNQEQANDEDLNLFTYKWLAPNSCFFDHTLEVLYRLWIDDDLMPSEAREYLQRSLSIDAFWSFLASHFQRRRDLATGPFSEEKRANLIDELARGQSITKRYIFDIWQCYPPGDYGCSISWMHHASRVRSFPCLPQMHFTKIESDTGSCGSP